MALSDLNLVVVWLVCDLRLWSTINFGFRHHALALGIVLCSTIHPMWMSWYLLHREIWNIVLWTPICSGCRDGNGLAITLYVFMWSSSVWMIWYHIGNMMLWVSITSLLVMVEVFDLYRFCTSWCPSSSIRAESGHCTGWGIWPLLILYVVMSIFIYPSWIWTLHYDWDIWFT